MKLTLIQGGQQDAPQAPIAEAMAAGMLVMVLGTVLALLYGARLLVASLPRD